MLSVVGEPSGRRPTTLYSQGTANVRAVMTRQAAKRLLVVSAIPGTLAGRHGIAHRLLWPFLRAAYEDMQQMEADLRTADDIEWTIFRVPKLAGGKPSGSHQAAVDEPLPGARSIRRADLAAAMTDAIVDHRTIRKIVTVAN